MVDVSDNLRQWLALIQFESREHEFCLTSRSSCAELHQEGPHHRYRRQTLPYLGSLFSGRHALPPRIERTIRIYMFSNSMVNATHVAPTSTCISLFRCLAAWMHAGCCFAQTACAHASPSTQVTRSCCKQSRLKARIAHGLERQLGRIPSTLISSILNAGKGKFLT